MRPLGVITAAGVLAIAASGAGSAEIALIEIEGVIGPATAGYIGRAIERAADRGAQCLIIRLDTPGGLLDSTQIIVQELLASPVPTVVYVAPQGAGAISAGCFITLAADVAAMAPATHIGAAHPVVLGGGGAAGETELDPVMKQKLENYAISYIETIAAQRKRNVEWAVSAVRDSAAITADKALELGVIEIVARDLDELLKALDGRQVNDKTLATANAQVVEIPMSPAERVFQMLWRPEVLMILMLIAVYGIIGELSNPGAILPGVAGAVALIIALYMIAVLPINIAGLALMALALILFIAEVFTPTYGLLTAGGVIAFLLGGLFLFDEAEPYFRLSLTILLPAALLTAAFFTFVVAAGLKAQWLPIRVGIETLLGKTVPALTAIDGQSGKIFVEGEYWNAVSQTPIEQGRMVKIVSVKGLTLTVTPAESAAA
jgi:membrane-bound serine protease (ClpP class)